MKKRCAALPLFERFREANRRYALLNGGEAVLVAVSGGPDSVALLHLLYTLREELSLTLGVAHLNHGMRGAEAEADAEYVAALAQRWELPLYAERADVPAYAAEHGLSLEMAAREVRYAFLERAAKQGGYARVALGHTASDRVETALLHLLRGTGLYGLRGMPPRRDPFIRPLITAWRAETEAYCQEMNLQPRHDSSNLRPDLALRNRLRHELLPHLREQYNPAVEEAILRLAEAAERELEWTEPWVQEAYGRLGAETDEGIALDLAQLRELAPGLRQRVWHEAWRRLSGEDVELEAAHYLALERLLLESQTGRKLRLPKDMEAQKGYNNLVLGRTRARPDLWATGSPRILPLGEEIAIPELGIRVRTTVTSEPPGELGAARGSQIVIDAEAMTEPLAVRSWQPGDTMVPLGMVGHKKLQDLLVDEKVPAKERSRLPVLVDGTGEIVWVAGVAMSERFRVTENTRRYLQVTVEECTAPR